MKLNKKIENGILEEVADALELCPFPKNFIHVIKLKKLNIEIWADHGYLRVTVIRLSDGKIYDNISNYIEDLIN